MKNIETYKYYIANNEYAIKNYLGLGRLDRITSIWWNDVSILLNVTYSNNKNKTFDYLQILYTSLDKLIDNEKNFLPLDKIADDLYANEYSIYLKALSNEENVIKVLIGYFIKKYSLKDKNNPYTLGGTLAVSYCYDILDHIRARSRVHYEVKR